MKKVDVSKYQSLKPGTPIIVETAEFGGKSVVMRQTKGNLISVSTRLKEIMKDEKPTGKFEQLAGTLVFDPDINTIEDPVWGTLHIIATVVGCGLFRLYMDNENE